MKSEPVLLTVVLELPPPEDAVLEALGFGEAELEDVLVPLVEVVDFLVFFFVVFLAAAVAVALAVLPAADELLVPVEPALPVEAWLPVAAVVLEAELVAPDVSVEPELAVLLLAVVFNPLAVKADPAAELAPMA